MKKDLDVSMVVNLVYDETLINAIKLSVQKEVIPMNMGQTRWYSKPKSTENYVVALDPSMGTGGDYIPGI